MTLFFPLSNAEAPLTTCVWKTLINPDVKVQAVIKVAACMYAWTRVYMPDELSCL